jgi:N-acetylglucosamine-6-phosphate deacetylase
MKCIINGKLILKDRICEDKAVIFEEKIEKIVNSQTVNPDDYELIDAHGKYVAPGLVDMHCHGYLGEDASDGKEDGLKKMAEGLVKNGVTSWCPTTMTVSIEDIEKAFDSIRTVKSSDKYYGAKILGANCEGPFINELQRGAQSANHILKPDGDFIIKHSDVIKLFTIAPEVDGALECIEKVKKDTNILISMGHTNASFEEAMAGINMGVNHTTHLFNAMSLLNHHAPSSVGAALCTDITVELIADKFHVDKELFKLVAKMKSNKVCLITDCVRAGGMPDGCYTLGNQPIRKEGVECRMLDGTIAGSVLKLNEAIYNYYSNTNLTLFEAVNCASLNPAIALGEEQKIGSIEVGKSADMIIIDEKFNVFTTIIDGEIRHQM